MVKYTLKRTEKAPFDLKADKIPPMIVVKDDTKPDMMKRNKRRLWRVLCRHPYKLTGEEKRIIIAVAMQETQHMDISEHDGDKKSLSTNVSILNINYDMLHKLGYRGKNFGEALNRPAGLKTAVSYATKAMRTWTAKKFLDFHRGGRTGFDDPRLLGTQEYRNAIAAMMPLLRDNVALASKNDKRIQIDVEHLN